MTSIPSSAKRVILAGGSGFIGRQLARRLSGQGCDVVILTRSPRRESHAPGGTPGVREVAWDGRTCGPWWSELEGADGVVNLAGRTVNCRPTPSNIAEVIASRVDSARALGEACGRCAKPPRAWVQTGALAYYGDTGDEILDETSPAGVGHAVGICVPWESSMRKALPDTTRGTILRIGIVLGMDGGALPTLVRLVRLGLGGSAGSGRQWVSWIHADDMLSLIEFALFQSTLSGPVNACTAFPVTNQDFMREIRRAVGRPWSPPAPSFAVRLGAWLMGTDARLALTGRRCHPRKLIDAGFQFRHPQLRGALQDLLGGRKTA